MSLRSKTRKKDGKEHRYWSVVGNRRVAGGRVVQRHVWYLGKRPANYRVTGGSQMSSAARFCGRRAAMSADVLAVGRRSKRKPR